MITDIALNTTSILKLLEPFRCLRGLASVNITGEVSDEYKSILIAKMMERRPNFIPFLKEFLDIIEQSDQAASTNDYPMAVAKYKRALKSSIDNKYWDPQNNLIISKGRFSEKSLKYTLFQTRRELERKLGVTYLKMKKHRRAHEWFTHLLVSCCSGAEHASLYCLAAQASEGLGEVRRAFKEMKLAVSHNDANRMLAIELVRLESKMKHGDGEPQVLEDGR